MSRQAMPVSEKSSGIQKWCGRTKFDSPALGLTPCGTQEALSLTGLFEYRDSMNTEQSVDTQPTTNRRRQPCRSVNMGPPVCVCNNEEEQWAQAVELIHETSSHFAEVQDRKAAWDLLAKCFPIQFFDLLNIPAPYTLQGRQGKETNKARLIQNLPEEAQRELKECEETLKMNTEQSRAEQAEAIGELVRPTSSTGPVTEPASDTDPDDIIIELLKLTTPKKVKIKKEPKQKKTVKASKVKSRVTSTRRTKKTPKTPSLVVSEDDLFGSVSEDETTLLASPKTGPSTVPTPEPTSEAALEPIEVDPVDLEIHPTQADLLGQDAERINFD
ncbi:hypothetical protein DAPPUDRAFT_270727 [Daphnia pulex]|uniref:Uncharacterized protein n=1 Tax=Daphnia pulex TaxID=6669 RepID=E9I174_DAPPU|nr:hypothetical protein DAPPUDRAFT_270727 [Daphnia pulex]|eukprot:EFX62256.1 hypothetical protein DAPPUDRAFT_270727 [Daphnia pulex]